MVDFCLETVHLGFLIIKIEKRQKADPILFTFFSAERNLFLRMIMKRMVSG